MTREELQALVKEKYGIAPDYPFDLDFETAVFRHVSSRKWFGIIIRIPKSRLGLEGDEVIDIVNFKCDPEVIYSLACAESGIFRAYHMNKAHWLSVALDGSCDDDTVTWLLDISYELTKPRGRVK